MNQTSQILAKFKSKNKRFSIEDESPYSIPVKSNGETLNLLIKSILVDKNKSLDEFGNENDETTALYKKSLDDVEFDFFINGEFIESSLDQTILAHKINTESVIEIDYIERYPPPTPIDTILTDDWVCSIQAIDENMILLGSYDHSIQIWEKNGNLVSTLNGHTGAVKAVSLVSNKNNSTSNHNNKILSFISGSHDQSLIMWDYNQATKKVEKTVKCIGHKESVECLSINADKSKFVSGSWDKTLKLWSLIDDLPEETESMISKKKSKSDIQTFTKTPLMTLVGHGENISSCKWIDNNNVCTASWDHSIKLWDVFVGHETQTLKSVNKIFLSIDYSPLNKLIAAGLSDQCIRIYDPRSREGSLVKITLSSHSGWCSSVNWSTTDENLLVSGSYDSTAKLWDIRNNKTSLFEMIGHEDKILCTDWSLPSLILTGSADNSFKIFNSNQQ